MKTGKYSIALIVLLLLLAALVLINNAWLGDDAFITYRTVDNFVNGYGLTWNTGERVQAYTHPLWMFLVLIAYSLTGEIFFTAIFLCVLVALAGLAVFAFKTADSRAMAIVGLALFLLSKPFIDFSVSGLENPLSHLLIILFYSIYFRSPHNIKTLSMLSLICAFGLLNRMDAGLVFLPALVFLFFKLPRMKAFYVIVAGLSPFFLWVCFSLFYYGFPFPNTAYAKLNTGIDSMLLVTQGFIYLKNVCIKSPLSAIIIIGALLSVFVQKQKRFIPPAIGILMYLIYVVKVGGDFMSGRFITIPFVCAVVILSQLQIRRYFRCFLGLASALIIFGLIWPRCPVWSGADFGAGIEAKDWDHGISDERAGYFQVSSFLNIPEDEPLPYHKWAKEGRELSKVGDTLVKAGAIGFLGYCGGPRLYILGGHALDNLLLARLPVKEKTRWRIGHFARMIPEGYLETLKTGKNVIADRDLAKYYDKLSLVISGNLFSLQRLKEIIKFNLGFYDHLIERYLSRPLIHLPISKVNSPKVAGTPYNCRGCYILSGTGINIYFPAIHFDTLLEISVDHNDAYKLIYYMDTLCIDSQTINARWIPERGLRVDTLKIAGTVVTKGFNNITIKPVEGDGLYGIGHIRLFNSVVKLVEKNDLESVLNNIELNWPETKKIADTHSYADKITLKAHYINYLADSQQFIFVFQVNKDIDKNYKIFFHVDDEKNQFHNFDFLPDKRTHTWRKGDIVVCKRSIPLFVEGYQYIMGFFSHEKRLGKHYNGVN